MDDLRLSVEDDPDGADVRFLDDRLYEFNAARTGIHDGQLLAVWRRDDGGAIVGGLHGWTWGGWLEVRVLWVHEDTRGQGLGRRLLEAAEAEALRRGCHSCLLDTHTFQSPAFYLRLGYEEVASVDGYPAANQRHYFRKRLH